jgi:hypothetical protein
MKNSQSQREIMYSKYFNCYSKTTLIQYFQFHVFWDVILSSVAVGYHCFRGPFILLPHMTSYMWSLEQGTNPWHDMCIPEAYGQLLFAGNRNIPMTD